MPVRDQVTVLHACPSGVPFRTIITKIQNHTWFQFRNDQGWVCFGKDQTGPIGSEDRVICRDDPRGQAVYILDKILSAVSALGGQRSDIVRTRVYLANQDHCENVSRVHGRYFEGLNPVNTTIEVSNLIGDHLVEIEAEAIVDEG